MMIMLMVTRVLQTTKVDDYETAIVSTTLAKVTTLSTQFHS